MTALTSMSNYQETPVVSSLTHLYTDSREERGQDFDVRDICLKIATKMKVVTEEVDNLDK